VLDGYVRVSQVAGRSGDSFISPAVQREQIQAWADGHRIVLGEVYEEMDESGGRRDRPLLMEAIRRIEAGESEGLVVARLDRFGRSLIDGLSAIERIRDAGGVFVSAQDGLDLRTDSGKLVLRIMLSMAEWELDRIRTTWRTARLRATARGIHLGRTAPFGYRRTRDGRLEPDPENATVLQEVFRRRADGARPQEIAEWLEELGVRTMRGGLGWTRQSLRGILKNRTYLGELRAGSFVARNTHPALVDRATWQRAQEPSTYPRRRSAPTLLGGILRCSACRFVLHSQNEVLGDGRRISNYFCHARSSHGSCPLPAYVTGPVIEPFVEEMFFGELERSRCRPADGNDLQRLEAAVDLAERALDSYRDDPRIQDVLGATKFHDGLRVRKERLDAVMVELARERRASTSHELPAASEMASAWPTMSLKERRAAIARVMDCVFIDRGWGDAASRAHICLRGHAPPGLPRRGGEQGTLKPFNPRSVRQHRLRRPRRWTKGRVEAELTRFAHSRVTWPGPEEFLGAGQGLLYTQVLRIGGVRYWSKRMGFPPPRSAPKIRWDSERAKAALLALAKDRDRFPTAREFRESGHEHLYRWLSRNGGIRRWQREVGL
jgi:DNA invertase Pin-like site-specific DNA recombinase